MANIIKNDMTSFYSTEQENVIRERWLKSFKTLLWLNICYFVLMVCFASYWINPLSQNNEHVSGHFYFCLTALGIIVMMLLSYLSYYFGYKRRWTFFLVMILFFGWIKFLEDIFQLISNIRQICEFVIAYPINAYNIIYLIDISLLLASVYYLINCWRLYKLNRFLKSKKNEFKN